MVRVITQETFDDVVRENIEDLDMSPEEAVKDASAQFEAQGVDLSNIIKELVINANKDHLVSASVKKLKELSSGDAEDSTVIAELNILKGECDKSLAHRVRAGKEGAYPTLLDIIERRQAAYIKKNNSQDGKLIIEVLKTLSSLMDVQPDLLEDRGVMFMKHTLENIKDESILTATLHWASTCCLKHENNRRAIFKANIPSHLTDLLKNGKSTKLLLETLHLMRRLTLDDDVRIEFGKAHEHARDLATGNLDVLQRLLKEHQTPPLVTEIMATLACVLVRNELCEAMSNSVPLLLDIISDNSEHRRTLTQAYTLITALAGNDDVKRKFVNSGIAPILVSLMQRHSENALTSATCLKCVASLCLREVDHSKQFLEAGAPDAIVACMNVHTDVSAVQKNGCWAIRNMVARCREYNAKFHELGIEGILNQAYEKYSSDFGFDIKSALRDLECDVKLDEQWTGKGVQMEK